jgi:hypothetical protein
MASKVPNGRRTKSSLARVSSNQQAGGAQIERRLRRTLIRKLEMPVRRRRPDRRVDDGQCRAALRVGTDGGRPLGRALGGCGGLTRPAFAGWRRRLSEDLSGSGEDRVHSRATGCGRQRLAFTAATALGRRAIHAAGAGCSSGLRGAGRGHVRKRQYPYDRREGDQQDTCARASCFHGLQADENKEGNARFQTILPRDYLLNKVGKFPTNLEYGRPQPRIRDRRCLGSRMHAKSFEAFRSGPRRIGVI